MSSLKLFGALKLQHIPLYVCQSVFYTIYYILAETNRSPFDISEGEGELVSNDIVIHKDNLFDRFSENTL